MTRKPMGEWKHAEKGDKEPNSYKGKRNHSRLDLGNRVPTVTDIVDRIMNQGDLLDLRRPAAGLLAVINRIHERIRKKDTPEFRTTVLSGLQGVNDALDAEDIEDAQDKVKKLLKLADRAIGEDAAWSRLADEYERFGKRVEKTNEIRLKAADQVSAKTLIALMSTMQTIIFDECDEPTRERVVKRIDQEIMGSSETAKAIRDIEGGAMADGVQREGD